MPIPTRLIKVETNLEDIMKSLILSSGFGTRLYPLTTTIAKGLLEYKGRPLINYIVDKIPQDVDILVNINKKFEDDFHKWQKATSREITLCVEGVYTEDQSFGAIGSVNHWVTNKNITDDLMVIASDNYFGFDISKFISAFNGKDTLIAVHDIGDKSKANQYGVVQLDGYTDGSITGGRDTQSVKVPRNKDKYGIPVLYDASTQKQRKRAHKIAGFEEKPAKPKSSLIATACWILPSRVLALISEFCAGGRKDNLGSFIVHLITREDVYAYPFNERWFDVGSIEVYESIQETPEGKDSEQPPSINALQLLHPSYQ